MTGNRKRIRHYHEPGDLHELTFSCYRRLPLLTNDVWREMLCRSIDRALELHAWRLVVLVLMPEHVVHLLVYPTATPVRVDRLLSAVKRPHSARIRRLLETNQSPLLTRLTVLERPGKWAFRYWQEGPGYDRNLSTEAAVMAAIDYIHENPVRRGLAARGIDGSGRAPAGTPAIENSSIRTCPHSMDCRPNSGPTDTENSNNPCVPASTGGPKPPPVPPYAVNPFSSLLS